jgi:hypothetical protein
MRKLFALFLAVYAVALAAQSGANVALGSIEGTAALLRLSQAARVSLIVQSPTGRVISLHDKMEGEIARDGSAGSKDGRIDISLDAGEYRVRLEGDAAGIEHNRLSVRTFSEVNGPKGSDWPRLIPGKVAGAELKDLESASYWIELREDGALEAEALGRCLAVMEIWREGQYLVGSYPVREERQVEEGRPMGYTFVSAPAKAGRYLVKVYGGIARPWKKDEGRSPLYVRSGFVGMPAGGRLDLRISPFGRDFVMVEAVDTAWLSSAAKINASLAALSYTPGGDRLASSDRSAVRKDKAESSCRVDVPRGKALLTVEAEPGQNLRVEAFRALAAGAAAEIDPRTGGLVTILSAKSTGPELPVTALIYRVIKNEYTLAKDFAAPVSGSQPFRARCNLSDDSGRSVILRVDEAGSYQIAESDGATQGKALYTLQPLGSAYGGAVNEKTAPAWERRYELVKGYYLLRIDPQRYGVLDFAFQKAGLGRYSAALAREPAQSRQSLCASLDQDNSGRRCFILGGGRGDGAFGYNFIPYPVNVDDGLSLDLGPRETIEFPSSITRRGVFNWSSKPGNVSIGGQVPVEGGEISPARRTLAVDNTSAGVVSTAFSITETFDDLGTPSVTAFGVGMKALTAGSVDWRDFGRADTVFYSFEVKESSVYVIETIGRLATSMTLRTASRPSVFAAQANGYGRNAAIRAWLRPGQYYLTVSTADRSTGRAGVRIDKVPLAADTPLEYGVIDRRAVPADAAARFSFSVPGEDEVELRSVALTGSFGLRLEDAQGFIAYRGEGRARLKLGPGPYTLYSLPASIDTNRLTWIRSMSSASPPSPPIAGTKALVLNIASSALWIEGPQPDRWSFYVPSPLTARLDLTEPFEAVLDGPGGTRTLEPKARASIELVRGVYSLAVRPRDAANQLTYSIGVYTSVLAPGVSGIAVSGSSTSSTRVSVPEDGFYELWSLGRSDVAARLYSEPDGSLLSESDDNGPDWNFDIVRRLKAGYYRLEISTLTSSNEQVELRMMSRNAKSAVVAAAPFAGKMWMDGEGIVLPFDTKPGEGLYLISAAADPRTAAPVDLRLYRGDEFIASGRGEIAVPLRAGGRYSLYAWTALRSEPTISIKRLAEKDASLSSSLSIKAGEAVRLRNPEALSALVESGGILVSPGLEQPCYDPGVAAFSTSEAGGWAWAPASDASIKSLVLREGEGLVLGLSDVGQGFASSAADKVLVVSVDTRGQFRCGISAKPAASSGAAAFDWDASAAWSQGSVALLPPGDWKARIWDGERGSAPAGSAALRRVGVGLDTMTPKILSALAVGGRETISVPPGSAVVVDLPACTLSMLMGRDMVASAWKDGEAFATRTSRDGRISDTLSLPACTFIAANLGAAEASLRLSVLPPSRSAGENELSAARSYEVVDAAPEGVALVVKASEGDLLCLAGDGCEAQLECADGRYAKLVHDPASALVSSMPASSGTLRLRSKSGGLLRAYLAKKGKEVDGLLDQGAGAAKNLVDVAALSGKGDLFRFKTATAGYVDLSCPGPGILALSGAAVERRVVVSGSRADMHLFAWLPAGEYSIWQRPARGGPGGGFIRADKVESRPAEEALGRSAFIGAREYQAWSFEVKAAGKIGVGIKSDTDGLQGFIYDARQGLAASGPLCFPKLEAGTYLFVVKGLDMVPVEYELVLEGLDGSRTGVPQDVADRYKAEGGGAASVFVPMQSYNAAQQRRGADAAEDGSAGDDEYSDEEYYEEEYYEDGEYYEDEEEYYEDDYESEEYYDE